MNRTLGITVAVAILFVLGVLFSCIFTVNQTQQALVVQFGAPQEMAAEPGLHFKLPWQQVYFFDKRLLDLDAKSEEVISQDSKRIQVDAFARWRIVDPLLFYQTLVNQDTALVRLTPILSSNIRRVLGSQNFAAMLSAKRSTLMHEIRDNMNQNVKGYGIVIADVRISRADLPPENSVAIYHRMQKERQRAAAEFRAEGDETAQRIRARAEREVTVIKAEATRESEILRGEGDAEKTRILAQAYGQDPQFFAFYRAMQSYKTALPGNNTTVVLSPNGDFLKYLSKGPGGGNGK
ncbi:MAG: protease modulator HflC [Alphaproteobacteria bacterium]|nr:protease modulator HflC [Alphaproteobacteria bacterium]MDE2111448.1 protease modulator HflC [Alphaproteobacteria bacterium]MDE2494199.1 protease modulator HflC [Alphaproteobacteria bacterium]